ncbi:MAG TPA: T9SS type A sorting domain-containing protein [Flavobacterium sp.]|nr:T9SS type A sorting domain-containing protein [Flavobacterium sp.]
MRKVIFLVLIFNITNFCNAQCFNKIANGAEHTLVIHTDGSLWSCGSNSIGQLGYETPYKNDQTFLKRIGLENDWQSVAVGTFHSLAIKSNGTLWAWGSNGHGELGDGNSLYRQFPTQIGTENNWESIVAGYYYTIAIKKDGTLWSWGYNFRGRLGLGDNFPSEVNSPTQIGNSTDWETISAGSGHVLALKTDGTLWSWGDGYYGQLGNGTSYSVVHIPTQIGNDTDWKLIACGDVHSLAIKEDGSLWTWGKNIDKQLGDGTNINREIPTKIGIENDWKTLDGGAWHSLAIKNNGSLWWWGTRESGGLYGSIPTQYESDYNWQSISATTYNSGVLQSNNILYSWGRNESGEIGVGSRQSVYNPIQIDCLEGLATREIIYNKKPFSIYPNPVKEKLFLKFESQTFTDEIIITDFLGKTIIEQKGSPSSINVQNLQSGIYLLQIDINGVKYQTKFLKD